MLVSTSVKHEQIVGTDTAAEAVKDPKTGLPQSNTARQVWITETALGTALNTSFFASQVGLFAIVMGVALLLTGIGFLLLASGLLGSAGVRRTTDCHVGNVGLSIDLLPAGWTNWPASTSSAAADPGTPPSPPSRNPDGRNERERAAFPQRTATLPRMRPRRVAANLTGMFSPTAGLA